MYSLARDVSHEAAAEFHGIHCSITAKAQRQFAPVGYHRCLFLYAGSQPLAESKDGNVAGAIN